MFKTQNERPLDTRTQALKLRPARGAHAIDLDTQSKGFLEAHRHAPR